MQVVVNTCGLPRQTTPTPFFDVVVYESSLVFHYWIE